jgi:hypothetical protein
MSQYEISEVFSTVDLDGDGLVSPIEWKKFYFAFVVPYYDQCDINHDYLLDDIEVKMCLNRIDSAANFRDAMDLYGDVFSYERLVNILSSRTEDPRPSINFHEYLYLRRATLAWK